MKFSPIFILVTVLSASALMFSGCSDGPVMPDDSIDSGISTIRDTQENQSHQCLGFYHLVYDPESAAVDVVPMRSSLLHLNVVGILNTTMGVSAVGVPAEHDPPNGIFTFDVTLTHPYSSKPLLTGFDVKGILMTPGTLTVGSLVFADIDETLLLNADGYTRWWNPTEFTQPGNFGYTHGYLANSSAANLTATINPYKYFADALTAVGPMSLVLDEPLTSDFGRGVFKSGNDNTRRYRIKFPMDPGPQITYGYAVDCAWAVPNPTPPVQIPDDFPINANQPEAVYVSVEPFVNTLYFDTESGVGGGVLRLKVDVHDWQGQAGGNIEDEISMVRISAPGLMSSGLNGVFEVEGAKSARYSVDLTGLTNVTKAGPTQIICLVESTDGSTYKQTGAPAPDVSLCAYQVILLDIPNPTCGADSNNDWGEAVEVQMGDTVEDQICLPDDGADYYSFSLESGYAAFGQIALYTGDLLAVVGLYDSSQSLIQEDSIISGFAGIPLDASVFPGNYFIKVSTINPVQVAPYLLDLDAELTCVIPENPVEITPPELNLNAELVYRFGDRALLVGRFQSWLYDASLPANPQHMSDVFIKIQAGPILRDITSFSNPYLYTIAIDGVNFADFSVWSSPVAHEDVVEFNDPDSLYGMSMTDTMLFLSTNAGLNLNTVHIYDISGDPSNPTLIDTFQSAGSYVAFNEPITPPGLGTYLVTSDTDVMYSYNVTNPSSVTQAGFYTFSPNNEMQNLTTGENMIVCTAETTGGQGYVRVFEQMTNAIVPHGSLNVPGSPDEVALEWPYVYVCSGEDGLSVCDYTDWDAPVLLATIAVEGGAIDVSVKNQIAWVVTGYGGLEVINCTSPSSPIKVSNHETLSHPLALCHKDGYILVSDNETTEGAELNVVDISDPSNAHIVSELWLDNRILHMDLDENLLVTSRYADWGITDVSDPVNPFHYTSIHESDILGCLAIKYNTVYMFVWPDIRIYDVGNPYSPAFATSFAPAIYSGNFDFYDTYMYAQALQGIEVYLITDPLNPIYLTTYSESSPLYRNLAVQGPWLYMTTTDELEIASLGNPASPVLTGSEILTQPAGEYRFLTVSGQYCYAGAYDAPMVTCRSWPPDNPAVGDYLYPDEPYYPNDAEVVDNILYMASGIYGLRIFQLY